MMSNLAQISDFSLDNLNHAYLNTLDEVAPVRVVKIGEKELISTKVAALQKRRQKDRQP